MSQLPSTETLQTALTALKVDFSPSYFHGLLCAYLSASRAFDKKAFIRFLTQAGAKASEDTSSLNCLSTLCDVTKSELSSFSFEFSLLLPEDDTPLDVRAKALADWSQGFVDGMKQTGMPAHKLTTDDAKEALEHMNAFAELDYDEIDISENDEKSFMELYEYIRMAVVMIYSELNTPGITTTPPSNDSVH